MARKHAQERHWGIRSVASLLLFVIAAFLTPVAAIGHWGHHTVTDTTQYLDTVGPLIESPQIQAAITDTVTNVIVQQVDTEAVVGDVLGSLFKDSPLAEKLSAPLAAGVNGLIHELVQKFVASDAFQDVWIKTNEVAQKSLIALLDGDQQGPIQLDGNKVVLDVSSLLDQVKNQVVASGLTIAQDVTIPKTDTQIVLLESPIIGQIQLVYQLTAPILAWFPLIIAVLFGLAIALARNRPRTVLATGVALIALAGVSLWLMDYAETMLIHDISGTVLEGALTSFWSTFFAYLLKGLWAMILLGVIVGLGGWYAGRSRPATAIREAVCRGLHSMGPAGGRLNSWVRSWAPFLRWTTMILLTVALTLGNIMDSWRVFWVCALGAGILTAIEILNSPDRDAYAEQAPEPAAAGVAAPTASDQG
jgi:hypothetical protein